VRDETDRIVYEERERETRNGVSVLRQPVRVDPVDCDPGIDPFLAGQSVGEDAFVDEITDLLMAYLRNA